MKGSSVPQRSSSRAQKPNQGRRAVARDVSRAGVSVPPAPSDHASSDNSSYGDPKAGLKIVTYEALPRPQYSRIRSLGSRSLHPPSQYAEPIRQNCLIADGTSNSKTKPRLIAKGRAELLEENYSLGRRACTVLAVGTNEFGTDRWRYEFKASTDNGCEPVLIEAAPLCGVGIKSLNNITTSSNEGFLKPSLLCSGHLSECSRLDFLACGTSAARWSSGRG